MVTEGSGRVWSPGRSSAARRPKSFASFAISPTGSPATCARCDLRHSADLAARPAPRAAVSPPRQAPVMSLVSVDQDHQVVSESRIFDGGVLAVARGLLRPLQHPVNLGEVDVAEQRRITPPCGTPCFPLALSMTFSRCMTSASSTRWATLANNRSCRTLSNENTTDYPFPRPSDFVIIRRRHAALPSSAASSGAACRRC
jgi:hypothetical protein